MKDEDHLLKLIPKFKKPEETPKPGTSTSTNDQRKGAWSDQDHTPKQYNPRKKVAGGKREDGELPFSDSDTESIDSSESDSDTEKSETTKNRIPTSKRRASRTTVETKKESAKKKSSPEKPELPTENNEDSNGGQKKPKGKKSALKAGARR